LTAREKKATCLIERMDNSPSKKSLEEIKEERRRARWNAFLTPIITLASLVASVGLLMFILRACKERFPQIPYQAAPQGNSKPIFSH
jgi:hypothetical protein